MGGVNPIAVPQGISQALNSAGDKSNVDFDYLLQTAIRESSLRPDAKARSSSATGLFQFLDSTWLQVMKEQGPRLGYQQYADAITMDSDGDYVVKNKAMRKEILALREDPQIAADMAAAFTQSNGDYLHDKFGRMPSPGELYIAHFLGPQGAEKLFNAGLQNPDQSAAKIFPKQAKANPTIFYSGGEPRSIRELYQSLVAKHLSSSAPAGVESPQFATQQIAAAQDARWSTESVPSRFSTDDMSFTSFFSTEGERATAVPLIATDALQTLIGQESTDPFVTAYAAVDAAPTPAPLDLELGFVPLPAPPPLIPQAPPQMLLAGAVTAPPEPDGIPKPRVLMTKENNAFLVQLQTSTP